MSTKTGIRMWINIGVICMQDTQLSQWPQKHTHSQLSSHACERPNCHQIQETRLRRMRSRCPDPCLCIWLIWYECVYMYMCMCVCMCLCLFMHMCVLCMYIYVCVFVWIYTYCLHTWFISSKVHTHICTYTWFIYKSNPTHGPTHTYERAYYSTVCVCIHAHTDVQESIHDHASMGSMDN
jgi:hypothetical protein